MRPTRRQLVFGLLGLAILVALSQRDALDVTGLSVWLRQLGPWSAPVFVLIYALGTLLFVPGSMLTLAGGAAFGPLLGTGLSLMGATVGATAAFLIGRTLGGDWVRDRLDAGRLGPLVQGVEAEGWRFVAFVRLVPLFPFNLLNYALGLTRISLPAYVLTSAICMAPGAAAYSYLGHAGREVMEGTGAGLQAALVGVGLMVAAVLVVPRIAQRLRRAPGLGVADC